jgi:hypothetical protein
MEGFAKDFVPQSHAQKIHFIVTCQLILSLAVPNLLFASPKLGIITETFAQFSNVL